MFMRDQTNPPRVIGIVFSNSGLGAGYRLRVQPLTINGDETQQQVGPGRMYCVATNQISLSQFGTDNNPFVKNGARNQISSCFDNLEEAWSTTARAFELVAQVHW